MSTSNLKKTYSTENPIRRPYLGSCHCGLTRYIAYLTLPPPIISATAPPSPTIRICKCNCSTCHKMSFFHVRLIDPPNDFMVLAPLNPTTGGLKDYTCFSKNAHWYFCGTCGVRCFAFSGEGEIRKVEVEGKKVEAWMLDSELWHKSDLSYLTINAASIEPGQQGFDLREWSEKGWIVYFDAKEEVGEDRLGSPHDGGMY